MKFKKFTIETPEVKPRGHLAGGSRVHKQSKEYRRQEEKRRISEELNKDNGD